MINRLKLAPRQDVTVKIVALPGGGRVRVFTPLARGKGALLWIHGGGMVIGSASQDDRRCAETAHELGVLVASTEYRLAPEHPFPAPLDDCHGAWTWMVNQSARLGIDPGQIAIGGQSAGGGLAAGLVLRLRDEPCPRPLAQWLFCPMLDDRTAARRELDEIAYKTWNNRANRAGWTAYLGQPPGGPEVSAYAAPARRTQLEGLPPTFIGVGTAELFHDEAVAYAQALAGSKVPTELDVVQGATHAFEAIVAQAPISIAYMMRAHDWLARRFDRAQRARDEQP